MENRPAFVHDSGPIYWETQLHAASGSDHWLIEPFNAASACLFVLIAGYWIFRQLRAPKRNGFFLYAVVLLLVGGVGGTVYHASRIGQVWLYLDWMPIAILSASSIFWFTRKLVGSTWKALTITLVGFMAMMFLNRLIWRQDTLPKSTGYAILGIAIATPILLFLRRTAWFQARVVLAAVLLFGVAVVAREIDEFGWLHSGTHFLWHTFGAVATHLLLLYLWRTKDLLPVPTAGS